MSVVWIRLRAARLGRLAHAVEVGTGRVACGIGRADLDGLSEADLRSFEQADAASNVRRCAACHRAVNEGE